MARILVIDDEAPVREIIRDSLADAGHDVWEAAEGAQALRMIARQPVDLVISDILMPEKEGLETISEIRRDRPGTKIIAVSGGGRTGNLNFLEMAEKLGADRILAKPFTPDDLLAIVRQVLQPSP